MVKEKKLDYLSHLNSQQLEALLNIEQPVFILAGAGTGKTKVLTYKIFHLIEKYSINIENILAVTFTNKAAMEMKNRVKDLGFLLNQSTLKAPWIKTFHSACLLILMEHFLLVKLEKNFSIYNADDSYKLLKQIIKSDSKLENADINIFKFRSQLSFYKNQLMSPKELLILSEEKKDLNLYHLSQVYEKYEHALMINNAVDFDNLILKTIQLFKEHQNILAHYQNDFKYILVDEFQDINNSQYKFVSLLAEKHKKITVVGDDDQSIYSWRGANVSNMKHFINDYQNTVMIKLEKNYRSSNILLKGANSLIKNNSNRLGKDLWSERKEQNTIIYYQAYDSQEEAEWVANTILELVKNQKVSLKEVAVLYRINSYSRLLEETFRKKNMHYHIYGTVQFYERLEIKDILAFFTYLVNPSNEVALKRILKTLNFGIGLKTIEKLDLIKDEQNIDFEAAINHAIENAVLRKNILNRVKELKSFLDDLKKISIENSLVDILDHIFDKTNYLSHLESYENYEERTENIKEFRKSLENYQNHSNSNSNSILVDYMRDIILNQEAENEDQDQDFVSLMTLHHSKGLEFNYIFITGLVEGVLPYYRMNQNIKADLAEERRLLYVGITRTMKQCYMSSFVKEKNGFNDRFYPESSFLKEIDASCIQHAQSIKKKDFESGKENKIYQAFQKKNEWIKKKVQQFEVQDENILDLKLIKNIEELNVDDEVYHKEFGYCKILNIEETQSGTIINIFLKRDETKLILLFKYASLYKKV